MKKKILIISPSNAGTIASCTLNIIKAIEQYSDSKIRVVVANREPNGFKYYEDVEYLSSLEMHTSNMERLRHLKRIKRDFNPDISISMLLAVSTLNIISGGNEKKIGIFHSPLIQAKNVSLTNYIKCWLSYHLLYRFLDKLYAVSETTKEDVEKHVGKKAELVYNIHDFVRIMEMSKEEISAGDERIFAYNCVLYVGHLFDTKGVKRLLKAFANSGLANDNINLVFLGAGDNGIIPEKYIKLAKELNISQNTYFLGHQTNPYKFMKRSSMLVLPSYSEGLPGVLIEALSLGTPVISTDSSKGVWEIMQCYNECHTITDSSYHCKLGIITSNDDTNDSSVNGLSDAMKYINNQSCEFDTSSFDTKRFSGKDLVHFYTLE